MKLSFIVTTYNLEERLIRRCIRSISRQGLDNEDYEILVVDDESDVSPQPLIDELAEELPIRFFRQSHARQGAARNLALQATTYSSSMATITSSRSLPTGICR